MEILGQNQTVGHEKGGVLKVGITVRMTTNCPIKAN